MLRLKTSSALLVGLFLISGCDDDIVSQSKQIQDTLGIPVELKAQQDDDCLQLQLANWIDGIGNFSDENKALLRQRVSRFKTIVLRSTEVSQTLDGKSSKLAYLEYGCHTESSTIDARSVFPQDANCEQTAGGKWYTCTRTVCGNDVKAEKVINDAFHLNGPAPQTQIGIGSDLTLWSQAYQDRSELIEYRTMSKPFYDETQFESDPNFQFAVQHQLLEKSSSSYHYPDHQCGKMISAIELLQKL